jgi:hypothetical protein
MHTTSSNKTNSTNNLNYIIMKTITKVQVKSAAVSAVKVITYPAHLVAQTTADLINIGQAKAINAIDGTPLLEAMHDQVAWTQNKQYAVVAKGMELKDKWERQRHFNREQDIAKAKAKLDALEGVQHSEGVENEEVLEPKQNLVVDAICNTIEAITNVPAPPTMTAPAV